jgi:hypothetical protein
MPYFGGATYRIASATEGRAEAEQAVSQLLQEADRAGIPDDLAYRSGEYEAVFEIPAAGSGAYKLKDFVRGFSDIPEFLSAYRVKRTSLWTLEKTSREGAEEFRRDPDSYLRLFTGADDGAEAGTADGEGGGDG